MLIDGVKAALMGPLRRPVAAMALATSTALACLLLLAGASGAQSVGELGGSITTPFGLPAEGVVVDYFEAQADGSRGAWLGNEESDDRGDFSRSITPGCYVIVAIAPNGMTFPERGRWHEEAQCVEPDEAIRIDLLIDLDVGTPGQLGGSVITAAGVPAYGIAVDYFEAQADRTRGRWLGDEHTDHRGAFDRYVTSGCYVLVAIAPEGASFSDRGRWHEEAFCIEAGETVRLDLRLAADGGGPEECVVSGAVIETALTRLECDALVAIFVATGGADWSTNHGWLTPTDPCDWIGVMCRDGRPDSLALLANNLVGELPSEIGDLTSLRLLFVENNSSGVVGGQGDLRGPIPPRLAELTGLEGLYLSGNNFSGPIPSELGQLTDLRVLHLQDNELNGSVPPSIGRLSDVFDLAISGNALTGDMTEPMSGLRSANPQMTLDVAGPAQSNCLAVSEPDLATWVQDRDSDWRQCTP